MSLTSFFTGAPAKFKVTFADADTRQTVTTKVNEKDVEQYLFSASDNVCGTVRPAPSLPQRRSAAADRETVCGAPGGHRGHRWEEDGAHGHQDRAHRPHRCALLPPGPSTVHLGSCDRAWLAPSRLFTAPSPHPSPTLPLLVLACRRAALRPQQHVRVHLAGVLWPAPAAPCPFPPGPSTRTHVRLVAGPSICTRGQVRELETPGVLDGSKSYPFEFTAVEKQHTPPVIRP